MALQMSRRELLGVSAGGLATLTGCTELTDSSDTQSTSEPEFGETNSVWPMLGQNPANTAFADIEFPDGAFQSEELFEAANEDRTDAPILADDSLLVSRASNGDKPTGVFGIDAETGDQLWENTDYVGYTTPSVYGQTAFLSGDGMTAALNVNSGDVHWTQSVGGSGFYKTHLKLEDTVVVSSGTGQHLTGLDAYTGEIRWTSPDLGVVFGLATDGNRIIAARTSNEESGLVAVDPNSQEVEWTARETSGVSQPVLAGELILHTDVDTGTVHAFDVENGEEQWQYPTGDDVSAPPAVDQAAGQVFVVGPNQGLQVLALESGEELWGAEAPGMKQPIVTQNSVITAAGESIFQVSRSDQTASEIATPGKSISSPLSLGSDQIFFTARSSDDSGALTYSVTPQA